MKHISVCYHFPRDVKTFKKRTNIDSIDALMSCFLQEIHYDSSYTITLYSAKELRGNITGVNKAPATIEDITEVLNVDISKGSAFRIFHEQVQIILKDAIM